MPDEPKADSTEQAAGSELKMLRVNPARAKELVENLTDVLGKVSKASSGRKVRLVAVSKLKPAEDILALSNPSTADPPGAGHLHFGENYFQELQAKAPLLPSHLKFHYLGLLQSSKLSPLARLPNLHTVSALTSTKHARLLSQHRPANLSRLRVHIQVNTSGEESKGGLEPKGLELLELAKFVRAECDRLWLRGFMTIGALARSKAAVDENEDFRVLVEVRDRVLKELGPEVVKEEEWDEDEDRENGGLELSMGMSDDYEVGIKMGAGEVRIGSTIFGQRPSKQDAVVRTSTT